MAHTVEVIGKKRLSDGQISVLMQCCGDADHTSCHTLQVGPDTTADDIDAWVAERKAAIAAQHAAVIAAEAHLGSLT